MRLFGDPSLRPRLIDREFAPFGLRATGPITGAGSSNLCSITVPVGQRAVIGSVIGTGVVTTAAAGEYLQATALIVPASGSTYNVAGFVVPGDTLGNTNEIAVNSHIPLYGGDTIRWAITIIGGVIVVDAVFSTMMIHWSDM